MSTILALMALALGCFALGFSIATWRDHRVPVCDRPLKVGQIAPTQCWRPAP